MAFFLGPRLHIAARQIETDAIRQHARQRLICGNLRPALAEGCHQFDFVMQVRRLRRITHRQFALAADQRIGRLAEEKRRFQTRRLVMRPHFTRMFGVIAAHTEDAPHGKNGILTGDRHRYWRRRRKKVNSVHWRDYRGPR